TNRDVNNIAIYDISKELGSGGFGTVFKVKTKNNGEKYAIKKCSLSEKQKQDVLNETKNLIKLRSTYIIQYYFSWIQWNCVYILMECLSGNLTQILRNKKMLFGKIMTDFEYYISYELFDQLVKSMEYLHKNHIIHRDLKPDNVLIDDNYYSIGGSHRFIKLCDFGLSKEVNALSDRYKQSRVENTPDFKDNVNYMALEGQTTEYNHLIDVYSLALIGAKIFGFDSDDIRDGVYIGL
ncbi:unnamed protein product, partial [Medioppia subpectinata]